jgi:hypothetical protein
MHEWIGPFIGRRGRAVEMIAGEILHDQARARY